MGSELPSGVMAVELWYRFSLDNMSWGDWVMYEKDMECLGAGNST